MTNEFDYIIKDGEVFLNNKIKKINIGIKNGKIEKIFINSKKYDAKKCINILKKKGVECRPFFCPMHLQPVFKKMKLFKGEKYLFK